MLWHELSFGSKVHSTRQLCEVWELSDAVAASIALCMKVIVPLHMSELISPTPH
jgi:hypothetical protein